MATRFYFDTTTIPPANPAFDAAWEVTGSANRAALIFKNNIPVLVTLADNSITIPATTTQDILHTQFVGPPMRKQNIGGTVSAVIRGVESSSTCNVALSLIVKVFSNDGSTSRGTLFSVFSTDTELPTVAATRVIITQSITPLTCETGDRLVVEVGLTATAPVGANPASWRFGDSAASDFALTTGLTTDLNPWIEFSQDIFTHSLNTGLRPHPFSPGLAR